MTADDRHARDVLDAALRYHRRGWSTLAIEYRTKGPRRRGWEKQHFQDEDTLRQAFSVPRALGVRLGEPSGNLVDLDLDDKLAVAAADELLPPTATFGRPGKPRSHRVYRTSDWSADTKVRKDPLGGATLVERRGNGSQTIFPPSHHESGEAITWEAGLEDPLEIERDELAELADRVAAATLFARHWPERSRHYTTLALAGWLARARWPEEDVAAFVRAVTLAAGDEEAADRVRVARETVRRFDEGESVTGFPTLAETIHERVLRVAARWLGIANQVADPTALGLTDVANVERLVVKHGGVIRYVPEYKQWFTWNGRYWEEDVAGRTWELVKDAHRDIYAEAARARTREERAAISRWAMASENYRQIDAAVKLARTRSELVARPVDLDADPMLLTVANGTLDLRTGDLRRFDPEDMVTRAIDVPYLPSADCPMFKTLVWTSFDGSEEMVLYLQRAVGLTIAGVVEKAVFVCYGPTDTGKTTVLTKVLQRLLGPYAVQLVPDAVASTRRSEPTMWMSELKGARYAVLSEPPRGMVIDASFIKAATGGNIQKGRRLFGMPFEFVPTATIWIDTNYRPDIPDSDDAIWNRLKPIHFKVNVRRAPGEPGYVPDFERALEKEMPGILAWAVEGCLAWQREGLGDPPEVRTNREEYRAEQDSLGDFIEDELEVDELALAPVGGDDNPWTRYQRYVDRVGLDRSQRLGKHAFNDALEGRGFRRQPGRVNNRVTKVWVGFSLRERGGLNGHAPDDFDVGGGMRRMT